MRADPPGIFSNSNWHNRADLGAFWLTLFLLAGVPLFFSTAVYRTFSVPKFALLLAGAAALVPLLLLGAGNARQRRNPTGRFPLSRQELLVSLLVVVIAISTVFGVSPVAALFGSSYSQMGLMTHVCFLIVFASLIVAIGGSETRFRGTLWAMTLTGLAVGTYAFVQFFGRDPFLHPRVYTFSSAADSVLRITSTIGHPDYLGNFLLYVTPVGFGLALSSHGRARRIALMAAGLSTLAIVFTGTRGAWLGLAMATLIFCVLTGPRVLRRFKNQSLPQRIRAGGLAFALVVGLIAIVALNPASRNIMQRARSLVGDPTGSGRTLLWRDSMKMITAYPIIGCGPEGFRKAFLAYKSTSLARHAPGTNNESSHNSFIDAAVSYGLPGAILYVAIFASSFSLLLRARRRTNEINRRVILESLLASLGAVAAHNFFIFDQISTGLYFYAFAALAQVAGCVASPRDPDEQVGVDSASGVATRTSQLTNPDAEPQAIGWVRLRSRAVPLGAGCVLFCVSAWYSVHIARADLAVGNAVASLGAGDLRGLQEHGKRAIMRPDPAGDYRFMLAGLLTLYADNFTEHRTQAVTTAMSYAEQSAAHTNTPDSNYVLLAYLALKLGLYDQVLTYASEAVKADPHFSSSHWLMAEAYLALGQREQAVSHARLALDLNPNSREARSALKRAVGVPQSGDTEALIRYGRSQASKGKINQALRMLDRAVRRSNGRCPDCRIALAEVYETAGRYEEAIREWQAFAIEAPDRALKEKTALRVDKLREAMQKR